MFAIFQNFSTKQSESVRKGTSFEMEVSTPVVNTSNGIFRAFDNPVISSSIESLYLNTETADVYFVFEPIGSIGMSERVPAHKNLLSITSDVFKAMFYGEWKVKGDVKMTAGYKERPQTASAFKEFLQYFYLKTLKLTVGNVAEVMDLGHRYNVLNCFNACIEIVSEHLTIENVCVGYGLALLYEHNVLKNRCERMITLNTGAVFNSASFLSIGKQVLANILHMELLSCTETDVVDACMRWITATTKEDKLSKETVYTQLGDLFYEIRFTSMTMKEFCMLNIRYDYLFTFDEYMYITQKITMPHFLTLQSVGQMFNNKQRGAKWNDNDVVKCCRPMEIDGNDLVPNHATPETVFHLLKKSIENGEEHDDDDEDEEMFDDEYSKESFTTANIPIKAVETTIFSTNKAIVLGKFVCANVRIVEEKDANVRELTSKLPVQVKIIEVPGIFEPRNFAKIKTIATFTSAIQPSQQTVITLPKPLLIRIGHTYKIHMQQTPEGHCFEYRQLKTKEVLIRCGTTIRFHDDKLFGKKPIGLIQEMLFNPF